MIRPLGVVFSVVETNKIRFVPQTGFEPVSHLLQRGTGSFALVMLDDLNPFLAQRTKCRGNFPQG